MFAEKLKMSLKIFVLMACVSICLAAKREQEKEVLPGVFCPECIGYGDTAMKAKEDCFAKAIVKRCKEIDPICAKLSGENFDGKSMVHQFLCLSSKDYDELTASCKVQGCIASKVQLPMAIVPVKN